MDWLHNRLLSLAPAAQAAATRIGCSLNGHFCLRDNHGSRRSTAKCAAVVLLLGERGAKGWVQKSLRDFLNDFNRRVLNNCCVHNRVRAKVAHGDRNDFIASTVAAKRIARVICASAAANRNVGRYIVDVAEV